MYERQVYAILMYSYFLWVFFFFFFNITSSVYVYGLHVCECLKLSLFYLLTYLLTYLISVIDILLLNINYLVPQRISRYIKYHQLILIEGARLLKLTN